ncbi:MAG: chemotaxis protein CheA [Bdellovibrionaceae bacterium]|nr:chemotaxis protein CheA [Pseudobdellovibrionaceae bacterium]
MMTDMDKELVDSFLGEAVDLVCAGESFILQIDAGHADNETWNGLFRIAHNIKGSAAAVGFTSLSQFAHQIENLLVKLRSNEIVFTERVGDCLLRCFDHLKDFLFLLKQDPAGSSDTACFLREIDSIMSGHDEPASSGEGNPNQNRVSAGASVPVGSASTQDQAVLTRHSDDTIKVGFKKIDDLLDNLGEQIILQNTLDQAKIDYIGSQELVLKTISQLGKLNYDIQQFAMRLRTINLRQLFAKLQRAVRDSSHATHKQVNLILEGEDQELDKSIVDAITDPLIHMVGNAVDHGLETPEERVAASKNPCGKITVRAQNRGSFFYIEVIDEGKGLDPAKILQKAIEKGFTTKDSNLKENEILELIFRNGFSTKEAVSDLSGRGVGMDVVKSAIENLKGTCQIASKLGMGTSFTLKLPLTLAVFNGAVVRICGASYIIPNSDIRDIVRYNDKHVRVLNKEESLIQIRDEVLPLIHLNQRLNLGRREIKNTNRGVIFVCPINGKFFAFSVDELITQQRVVYKPLSVEMRIVEGAVGATILGNGAVALILECRKFVNGHLQNGAA